MQVSLKVHSILSHMSVLFVGGTCLYVVIFWQVLACTANLTTVRNKLQIVLCTAMANASLQQQVRQLAHGAACCYYPCSVLAHFGIICCVTETLDL